jgi:hypothetical protein
MQAHPDPDGHTAWPVMAGEGALGGDARGQGLAGGGEDDEEAVAFRAQFAAAAGGKRRPQQRPLSPRSGPRAG